MSTAFLGRNSCEFCGHRPDASVRKSPTKLALKSLISPFVSRSYDRCRWRYCLARTARMQVEGEPKFIAAAGRASWGAPSPTLRLTLGRVAGVVASFGSRFTDLRD